MWRITLVATDQAAREHTCPPDRRLRDRCQAVFIAGRGRKRTAIAQDVGVHRTTVCLGLKRYREQGIEGCMIHWAPGQPGRIPATLAPTSHRWVKEGPQSGGLDRVHWTYEELATSLYQTQGITVKRTSMRDFCRRHHRRPYRPTAMYEAILRSNGSLRQSERH